MCGKDFFPMDTVGTNKVSFKSTNRGWWEESRGSADFSFKWISTPSFLYLFDLQRRSPFCLWRLPRPWMNCSLAAKSHCQSPQFGTSLDVWHQGREGFRHCQDWRDKCATSLSDLQWWSTNGSRGGLLSAIDHWMTGISNGFFKKDPCSATFFFFYRQMLTATTPLIPWLSPSQISLVSWFDLVAFQGKTWRCWKYMYVSQLSQYKLGWT